MFSTPQLRHSVKVAIRFAWVHRGRIAVVALAACFAFYLFANVIGLGRNPTATASLKWRQHVRSLDTKTASELWRPIAGKEDVYIAAKVSWALSVASDSFDHEADGIQLPAFDNWAQPQMYDGYTAGARASAQEQEHFSLQVNYSIRVRDAKRHDSYRTALLAWEMLNEQDRALAEQHCPEFVATYEAATALRARQQRADQEEARKSAAIAELWTAVKQYQQSGDESARDATLERLIALDPTDSRASNLKTEIRNDRNVQHGRSSITRARAAIDKGDLDLALKELEPPYRYWMSKEAANEEKLIAAAIRLRNTIRKVESVARYVSNKDSPEAKSIAQAIHAARPMLKCIDQSEATLNSEASRLHDVVDVAYRKGLIGVWTGMYRNGDGLVSLRLTITELSDSDEMQADFKFGPTANSPHVPNGEYSMFGHWYSDRRISLRGSEWKQRPRGYDMVDFYGELSEDASRITGIILNHWVKLVREEMSTEGNE